MNVRWRCTTCAISTKLAVDNENIYFNFFSYYLFQWSPTSGPLTGIGPRINWHRAAKLQNVYWWWHHALSGHAIGRFFPWKHCCESTPGPRNYKMVGDHCIQNKTADISLTYILLINNKSYIVLQMLNERQSQQFLCPFRPKCMGHVGHATIAGFKCCTRTRRCYKCTQARLKCWNEVQKFKHLSNNRC